MSLATPIPRSEEPLAPGTVLGRLGGLTARLARDDDEIAAAQRLRHDVFVGEHGAAPAAPMADGRERDRFDAACDHLVVVTQDGTVVGTYRLLSHGAALRSGHYSEGEFAVGELLARHPERRFLELGRSCTHPAWRDSAAIRLLWQGAWAYALRAGCDVMFGCASFPGTDPGRHAEAFAWLAANALVPAEWNASPATGAASVPLERSGTAMTEGRAAGLRRLPPLLKGYVRLGGRVASHGVVDPHFGCIDVLVVLPREWLSPRYVAHYGADAGRYAG